jgi:hypothetical protein
MSNCPKCNGAGYIETPKGCKVCTCKLAETIKSVLSKHPNILMAKEKKFNLELFPENTVINVTDMDKLNSILKTVFTYLYLKGTVRALDLIDSSSLMDAYFEKNDYYTMSSIKEADFAILIVEGDKQNKLLPDILASVASYRRNIICKPTWIVYISDEGKKIEAMPSYSGMIKQLNTYKFTFRTIKK